MRNVLAIARNDLKRLFREKAFLFWVFLGPLLFTAFFGLLFAPRPTRAPSIDLVNHDQGDYLARALGLILREDGIESRPREEIARGRYVLEIPEGAAASLAAGKPKKIVLHSPEKEETNFERRVVFRTAKALTSIYLQANPSEVPADAPDEKIRSRIEHDRSITIERGKVGIERRDVTAGFQRSVPSYLVMFIFLNLLISGAGIAEERAAGRLRRLFIAPVSKTEIVLGKLLGTVAVGWIQTAWLMLAGVLFFKIQWAEHSIVFFLFLTLYSLAAASLGMLLGTLFRDPDKSQNAAVWGAVLLSPLGGLWWPLEFVGPTMRTIGHLVPTGWAMESVNAMLAYGAGARDVAPHAAAFLALTAVSLGIAVRRLRP